MAPRTFAWLGAGSVLLLLAAGMAGPRAAARPLEALAQASTSSTADFGTSSTVADGFGSTTVPGGGSTSTSLPDASTTTTLSGVTTSSTSTTLPDAGRASGPDRMATFALGEAGSVTLRVSGGRLFVVSIHTEPGWTREVEADGDRVKVELERRGDGVRGRVKFEAKLKAGGIETRLETRLEND